MDWQTPVALLVVLVAALIAARWCWRFIRGSSTGCGSGCDKCPSNLSKKSNEQLIELKPLPPHSRR